MNKARLRRATFRKTIKGLFARIIVLFMAVILFATGLTSVFRGTFHYRNYWGQLVFGPLVTAASLLLIYAVLFRWEQMNKSDRDKKGRPMTWPTDNLDSEGGEFFSSIFLL